MKYNYTKATALPFIFLFSKIPLGTLLFFLTTTISSFAASSIPGKVAASNYTSMSGVEFLSATDDGAGQKIASLDSYDWIDYTFNVAQAGNFKTAIRVGCVDNNSSIRIVSGTGLTLKRLTLPNTGNLNIFQNVEVLLSFSAGTHTIRLEAEYGSSFNMTGLEFVLAPNNAPTVSITLISPKDTLYVGSNLLLTSQATDLDGGLPKVEYFINENKIGEGNENPYTTTWTATSSGSYKLYAKATDIPGESAVSPVYDIVVVDCNQLPVAEIISPEVNNTFNAPANVTIDVNAYTTCPEKAISKVEFYLRSTDYIVLAGTDNSAPFSFDLKNLAAGEHTVLVKAIDNTGKTSAMISRNISVKGSGTLIPALIQAENFNVMRGIQVQPTSDVGGGQDVSNIDATDFLLYNINVPASATYQLDLRIASITNARIQLVSGNALIGEISLPNTTGYQKWQTVSSKIKLAQGSQSIKLIALTNGFNINWLKFSEEVLVKATNIPGQLEAENFIAMNGVQTESTTDGNGGLNVGWMDSGDWMDYSVQVQPYPAFAAMFRVAGMTNGAQLQLISGNMVLATINIPNTGGWQKWTTVGTSLSIPAGVRTLRVHVAKGGFNLNWIQFGPPPSSAARLGLIENELPSSDKISIFPIPSYNILNLQGVENGKQIEVSNILGEKLISTKLQNGSIDVSGLNAGQYLLRIDNKTVKAFIKK